MNSAAIVPTDHGHAYVGRVSAHDARHHLLILRQQGVGIRQAAKLAGLSPNTVFRVRSGRLATLTPKTARAILAVRPLPAFGALVKAPDLSRRVDTLHREGFPLETIASVCRLHRAWFGRHHERVRLTTALRVRALFRKHAEDGR